MDVGRYKSWIIMLFNQPCHSEKLIISFIQIISVHDSVHQKITCTDKVKNNSFNTIIQHISHAQNSIYLKKNSPLISGKFTKLLFTLCNFGWNTDVTLTF